MFLVISNTLYYIHDKRGNVIYHGRVLAVVSCRYLHNIITYSTRTEEGHIFEKKKYYVPF